MLRGTEVNHKWILSLEAFYETLDLKIFSRKTQIFVPCVKYPTCLMTFKNMLTH